MSKAQGIAQSANQGQFKNRIINGAMMIDQRNAGASVNAADIYTIDRWLGACNPTSRYTIQQSTVAPAGFINSMLCTVTTPTTATAAQYFFLRQRIEGFNTADLGFGTANASTVTLSFWVRSSVTGTYCASLMNSALNRDYVATYTINSANTWEYKTITIAGDTTGTWLTNNGTGINVIFDLGSGSDYRGATNSWISTANAFSSSSQANWIGNAGATFYITGVQLEKGSTATSFDYRPYGTELALCQRYYQTFIGGQYLHSASGGASSSTNINYFKPFIVEMRTVPTFTFSGQFWADGTSYIGHSNLVVDYASTLGCRIAGAVSGANAGQGYGLTHNSANARLNFSAEL